MISPITIITPLAHEARALQATARHHGWTLLVCGPGQQGIERLAHLTNTPPAGHTVVLAGLAGGLAPDLAAGDLIIPQMVLGSDGEQFTPPLQLPTGGGLISTLEDICVSPETKASLWTETGAHAVDIESAHFAKLALQNGWKWGIVRGISDSSATELPKECGLWIGSNGTLRPLPLITSLLRDPRRVGMLLGLRRASVAAMASVRQGLIELLDRHSSVI